ncbi:MAG: ComF family protein [Deltaproteobacteria bacterium]|jgi:competence protein ComFC|nr:ComF family protein [Deltaproteobacteria bacterium]
MYSSGLIKIVLEYLCPPRCLICGQGLPTVVNNKLLQSYICSDCERKFDSHSLVPQNQATICDKCGEIFQPRTKEDRTCLICRVAPLFPDHLRSLYTYHQENNELLLFKFKYFNKFNLALPLANLISSQINQVFHTTNWDLIIPIPSAPNLLKKRGYNHTYLLAKAVAKELNITSSVNILVSKRERAAQTLLSPEQRSQNMQDAYKISPAGKEKILNKKILLIDDMLTTGATINSASQLLIANQVQSVDVLTLFRSSHFSKHRVKAILNS